MFRSSSSRGGAGHAVLPKGKAGASSATESGRKTDESSRGYSNTAVDTSSSGASGSTFGSSSSSVTSSSTRNDRGGCDLCPAVGLRDSFALWNNDGRGPSDACRRASTASGATLLLLPDGSIQIIPPDVPVSVVVEQLPGWAVGTFEEPPSALITPVIPRGVFVLVRHEALNDSATPRSLTQEQQQIGTSTRIGHSQRVGEAHHSTVAQKTAPHLTGSHRRRSLDTAHSAPDLLLETRSPAASASLGESPHPCAARTPGSSASSTPFSQCASPSRHSQGSSPALSQYASSSSYRPQEGGAPSHSRRPSLPHSVGALSPSPSPACSCPCCTSPAEGLRAAHVSHGKSAEQSSGATERGGGGGGLGGPLLQSRPIQCYSPQPLSVAD